MSYILIDSYGALKVAGKARVTIESSVSGFSLPEQEIDVDPFVLEVPAGTYTIKRVITEEMAALIEQARAQAEKERRIAYVRELKRRKSAGESTEGFVLEEAPEPVDLSCPLTFTVGGNETAVIKMKLDRAANILDWESQIRESNEQDGFLFFRNQLKEKHAQQSEEESQKVPHTIARGNRKKAAAIMIGIVTASFFIISAILLGILLLSGNEEENGQTGAISAPASEAYEGKYGESYAMDFIQDKWYVLYDENTFRTVEIDGSRIVYGEVYVEKQRTDNLSPDNIYLDGEIYHITGSMSREGTCSFSIISELHYNLDTVFYADAEHPEEEIYQIHVNINPDEENNIRINIFAESRAPYFTRGDLDGLRTYLKKDGG